MIDGIFHKIISYSRHKYAPYFLALCAFTESAFFIIPADLLLMPMCVGMPKKAFWYALVCTIAAVAGGVLGYYLGFFAYDVIGEKIINYLHYESGFNRLRLAYDKYGPWIIVFTSFLPIPFKLVTIFSGFTKINIVVFIAMAFISRVLRYFTTAIVICFFRKNPEVVWQSKTLRYIVIGSIILAVMLYFIFKH